MSPAALASAEAEVLRAFGYSPHWAGLLLPDPDGVHCLALHSGCRREPAGGDWVCRPCRAWMDAAWAEPDLGDPLVPVPPAPKPDLGGGAR